MFMKGALFEEKKSCVMNWNVGLGNMENFEVFFHRGQIKMEEDWIQSEKLGER